jgi:hypothetical protein
VYRCVFRTALHTIWDGMGIPWIPLARKQVASPKKRTSCPLRRMPEPPSRAVQPGQKPDERGKASRQARGRQQGRRLVISRIYLPLVVQQQQPRKKHGWTHSVPTRPGQPAYCPKHPSRPSSGSLASSGCAHWPDCALCGRHPGIR